MKLNDEQKAAVQCIESSCIAACPGSGKTRTIVVKIVRCVDDIRETPRRIACITYTHTAANEIERRLREFGDSDDLEYCEIGTIHSFCLNNILRPFYYRLPELSSGFDVFPPDSEEWRRLTRELGEKHDIDRRYTDYFAGVQREPDGQLFVPSAIPEVAAHEFVNHMDSNSLVTFADIVYHSFRLIDADPFIARGVANRFAWMLIDEFQDTSAGQVAILRRIAGHNKTQFFLIGDPNQSIMAFAGARPNLMTDFPVELKAKTDLPLSGNYRCSQKIVDHAEALIPTDPVMRAVGEWKDSDNEPEHVHTSSLIEGVFSYFLPVVDALGIPLGEAAVLAPWWTTLYGLARELRERGVPVRGPGARPYRYSNLFAGLAENLCAYVEEQEADLFRSTQRMLFIMLLNMTGNPVWRVYSYEGRRCLCFILSSLRKLREMEENAVRWLRSAANVTAKFLVKDEFITASQGTMILESAEGMVANMLKNKIDTDNLHVSDLALYARPKDCLRLISMHGAKGLEFDAVAIVDLHEGRVPDFRAIRDGNEEAIEEDRRQLYVAMTRPRKLLMYFTDSSHYRNQPSRFLKEIGVI